MTKSNNTNAAVWTDELPPLKVERMADGLINLIDPTEDGSGNLWMVRVHPVQLRWIAERVGLLPDVSASDAELLRTARWQIAELTRENGHLKRNLLRLHEHAWRLQRDFATGADWKHADLVEPMNQINALVSLFDMAVDSFADGAAHEPSESPRVAQAEPTGFSQQHGGDVTPSTAMSHHAAPRGAKAAAKPAGKASAKASQQLPLEG